MKVPDWMKMPLAALGMEVEWVERAHETRIYEDWNHSVPIRFQRGATHAVVILEKLFAANLLNLELQEGPVDEGETMLVRGMPMRVQYIQDRRLMLELPPGRRFRRREDGRLIKAAPRKAG